MTPPTRKTHPSPTRPFSNGRADGGYESLIGNTPLVRLPAVSALLPGGVSIYLKMESGNPGGTGKDRAARSMVLDAERRGTLPPPLAPSRPGGGGGPIEIDGPGGEASPKSDGSGRPHAATGDPGPPPDCIPPEMHAAILTALGNTRTHGIIIEGTSGSTGISLASLASTRGHGTIVVMPDDQSSQKSDLLRRLGCGVLVVRNCGISNPGHYVNVARRVWEVLQVERRYDDHYLRMKSCSGAELNGGDGRQAPRLIRAAFMDQFENLSNVMSHYTATGPEIRSQLDGRADAFVMSSGTGGTIVGVGACLKECWHRETKRRRTNKGTADRPEPRIVLVDPPGSSLYNRIKFGVAYASQQSERRLRRHRYDTLAEGIGLDRITANFALGCRPVDWDRTSFAELVGGADRVGRASSLQRRGGPIGIIDDALSITDQQAVVTAHYLLRHEGLFVGSSTAMNVAGAVMTAMSMPPGSNVVTVACDGGMRHTSRFWNRDFVEGRGLVWPDEGTLTGERLLECLIGGG